MSRFLKLAPLVLLAALFFTRMVSAAVTLSSFTATPLETSILIEWETASELDNAGFYVTRGEAEPGPYVRISDFLPSLSGGASGAAYEFEDVTVVVGPLYYYKLEAITNIGNSEFHGPITATLATLPPTATPTNPVATTAPPTVTLTPTPTPTTPTATGNPATPSPTLATQTPSNATATSQRTQTVTASNTSTPVRTNTRTHTPFPVVTFTSRPTATAPTLTPTDTQTLTPTPQPTATLVPLPSVTFIFPLYSPTPTLTPAPSSTPLPTATTTATPPAESIQLTMEQNFLIVVVVLLWVLLGAFIFFIIRRSQA